MSSWLKSVDWNEGGATPKGTTRAEDSLNGACRSRLYLISWSHARGTRRLRNGKQRPCKKGVRRIAIHVILLRTK